MQVSDSEYEDIVISEFARWGFIASKIPESHESRCDVHACSPHEEFIIEVKTRVNHHDLYKTLEPGTVSSRSDRVDSSRRVQQKVSKAAAQIKSTHSTRPDATGLIWWWARPGTVSELSANQLYGELYGARHVSAYGGSFDDGSGGHFKAFYVVPGLFERMPHIVGAILHDGDGLQLLVNELADQVDEFRGGPLYKMFAEDDAACDPVEAVRRGEWIAMDRSIDRDNESVVRAHLARSLGADIVAVIAMKRYSAITMVGRSNDRREE